MLEPHEWQGGSSPLGLSGWEVLKIEQGETNEGGPLRTYHVIRTARHVRLPGKCSQISCQEAIFTLDGRESYPVTRKRWGGRVSRPLEGRATRQQGVVVVDTPSHGGAVRWHIYRTRLVCTACGSRTFEALPAYVDVASRTTARCHRYIRHQATVRPYTNIARELGCHESFVRDIAKESYDPSVLAKRQPKRHPKVQRTAPGRYLGIDEIALFDRADPDRAHIKANRTTFVDLESGNVLGLIQSDDLPAVTGWIRRLSAAERGRIRAVSVDMHLGYKPAVEAALPGVPIVIDRYHVEVRAQKAADKVRLAELDHDEVRAVMKRTKGLHRDHIKMLARMLRSRSLPRTVERRCLLRDYLRAHPRTHAAVLARQEFGLIYETAKDKAEALARFKAWREGLDPSIRGDFGSVESALDLYPREIANYFDVRITNGPTESANSAMRRVVRAGPSIHIETLRAKVLARSRLRPTRRFFCDLCWERSPVDPEHHLDVTGDLVCEECRAEAEGREPRPENMRPRRRGARQRLTLHDLFAMEESDLKPKRLTKKQARAQAGTQLVLPIRVPVATTPRSTAAEAPKARRPRRGPATATQPARPVRHGPTPLRERRS